MLPSNMIQFPLPRPATSPSPRILPLSPFHDTHSPIPLSSLTTSHSPLPCNSTHPSQLDTPVPPQPLCFQSNPHAFRHTWGCASVFTFNFEFFAPHGSFRTCPHQCPHPCHSASLSRPLFSYSYALFCTKQNAISHLFIPLRTLCTNHPGGVGRNNLSFRAQRGICFSPRNWTLTQIRKTGRCCRGCRASRGGRVQLLHGNYVRRRWRSDLELRRAAAVRITRGAGLLAAAAERAARKSASAFSRMSPCEKTALPATRISAPARTISPIVSRATPPSISIRNSKPRALRIRASSSTFFSELRMKCCAPNPGFTDMINTWCTISSTSSSARTGVAGLITTPALQPCEEIRWSVRSR